jgi:sodium-dependent dicarboxylate transporter 2/3/5
MFVSDAATVAMMIPVGMSLGSFVRGVTGVADTQKSNFGALLALSALYGAEAGGTATIAGIPHNALAVALLERFTGRALGWFEWMFAGVPLFVTTMIAFYFLLVWFLPPEVKTVPGGLEFIEEERRKLGPLSAGEKATLFVFAAMVILFTLPTVVRLVLGRSHPLAQWASQGLSLWVVPPVIMLLLFSTPVSWREGKFILTWREAVQNSPWGIMILCTGAVAITDALVGFGFVEYAGGLVSRLDLGRYSLPFVASAIVAVSTNLISGVAATSFFGTILIPTAQQVGFNPASMAMLIPNVALGVMVPWAGAAAGTAFATGEIDMKNMIRIGVVCTVAMVVIRAGVHILLAPYL